LAIFMAVELRDWGDNEMAGAKKDAFSPPKKYSIQPEVSTRFMFGHLSLVRKRDSTPLGNPSLNA